MVDHQILLRKLEHLWYKGSALTLSVELILNRFLKLWTMNWKKSNSSCLNVNKTNFMVLAEKKIVGEVPKISTENQDI